MKTYDVVINGIKTTLQLSDADARARGLLKSEPEAKAKAPDNKSRTPANKSRSAAKKSTKGDA